MAYLDPKTLTCPDCGATAPIRWVVGKGPSSEGVAYVSALESDAWEGRKEARGIRVFCKSCGAEVAARSGEKA